MKRGVESTTSTKKRRNDEDITMDNDEEEDLMFEDPYGDDLEDEEMVSDDEEIIDDENADISKLQVDEDDEKPITKVWLPGVEKLGADEVLDYDSSAYDLYYAMTAEWPSLSLDIVRDHLGACRTKVNENLNCYLVILLVSDY